MTRTIRGLAAVLAAGLLAAPAPAANALGRDLEPVVLAGASLPSLLGAAPSRIVGFRHQGSAWVQIPVQVDERAVVDFGTVYGTDPMGETFLAYADPGTFTGADPDATFDADDEIALDAADAGDAADGASDPGSVASGTRLEITLANPVTTAEAFVYLFLSDGSLDPAAGRAPIGYVFDLLSGDYKTTYDRNSGPNPEDSSVTTAAYSVHFSDRWIRDGTSITAGGASGADILDRHAFRFAPRDCARTEDTFSNGEGAFIVNRAGPVRALRGYVGANSGVTTYRVHRFYARLETIETVLRVHRIPGALDYFDHSAAASGMTYTDDTDPAGVTIDGVPDAVTPGPLAWEQVSGAQGTMAAVRRIETDIAGLTATSFYSDDANPATPSCTGDGVEYGAHGSWIDQAIPNTDPAVPDPLNHVVFRIAIAYGAPGLGNAFAQALATQVDAPLVVGVGAPPTCPDGDGDGWAAATCDPGGDCDDADAAVHPGAADVCNLLDDDCDGTADDPACDRFSVDGDGIVDGTELAWIGRSFGLCSANSAGEWWGPVDYDGSGCIDGDDLAVVANLWALPCRAGILQCP